MCQLETILKIVNTMNSRRLFERRILLATFTLLLILLSTGHVSASETGKKLAVFAAGGRSYPVGQFADLVKISGNWGAGAELRFPSNWAIGIVVHGAEFEHQRVVYNSWLGSWRSIDWTFVRANWYAKYLVRKSGISPFVSAGLGIYSLEGKNTFQGGSQTITKTKGSSIVPGVGVEYSTKRALFFAQIDYNLVLRKSTGGCVSYSKVTQFFDLFLGVGLFV